MTDGAGTPSPRTEAALVMRFIGPNAEKFEPVHDLVSTKRTHAMISSWRYWNPVAAIFIYPWFMYRKLYAEAVGLFLAALGLSVLYPDTANATVLSVSLLMLFFANGYYVDRVTKKVRAIERLDRPAAERDALIAAQGGTAPRAAVIGVAMGIVIPVVVLMSIDQGWPERLLGAG